MRFHKHWPLKGISQKKYEKRTKRNTKYLSILFLCCVLALLFAKTYSNLTEPPKKWSQDSAKKYEHTEQDYIGTPDRVSASKSDGAAYAEEECRQECFDSSFVFTDVRNTDLAAQRGMWRATNTLAYLTFAQTVLGLFGLIFIIKTLSASNNAVREARKATKAAKDALKVTREASLHELRGYLALEGKAASISQMQSGQHQLFFEFHIKNIGRSPAQEFNIEILSIRAEFAAGTSHYFFKNITPLDFSEYRSTTCELLNPGQKSKFTIGGPVFEDSIGPFTPLTHINNHGAAFNLKAIVWYRDVTTADSKKFRGAEIDVFAAAVIEKQGSVDTKDCRVIIIRDEIEPLKFGNGGKRHGSKYKKKSKQL